MLLAIETAETACSAALIAEDGQVIEERHELVGRGHAERLIPMIADLLGARRPDSIVVDCGPGSFTGLRVGIAAARGLGLGWNVPVNGYASTALLAATGFERMSGDVLAVAMTGGHGQLFVERFQRAPFASLGPLASLVPAEAAAACGRGGIVVGSGARLLADAAIWDVDPVSLDLRAADVRLLPLADRMYPPRPIYGRAPDAKPKAA